MKNAFVFIIVFLSVSKFVSAQQKSSTDIFVKNLFNSIKKKDSIGYYRTVADIKQVRQLLLDFHISHIEDTVQKKKSMTFFDNFSDNVIRDLLIGKFQELKEGHAYKEINWRKTTFISYKVDTLVLGQGFLRLDGIVSFKEGIKEYAVVFKGGLSRTTNINWVGPKDIHIKLIDDGSKENGIKISTIKQEGIKSSQ